jgi:thiamine biosynthesis lipoprotein
MYNCLDVNRSQFDRLALNSMAESNKTSRREFLTGDQCVAGARKAVDDASEQDSVEQTDDYLFRMSRRAMACDFELLLNAGQYPQAAQAAFKALDLIDELESQLTVYRETSEVSRINQSAFDQAVIVEPRLYDLLKQAAAIHAATNGAYDISAGALSKLWGFYKRDGRMPTDREVQECLAKVGMQRIRFDDANHSVQFAVPGLEINLGSIGKGYALDRVTEVIEAEGIHDLLIHGGHSSIVARGDHGISAERASADGPTAGWWIGLRHPLLPKRRIIELRLKNNAVGTSGGGTQFFVHEGRRYSHILDPRTGRPVEGTLSVSVLAPTGAEADALATAFFVMGKDATIDYCRTHETVAAVIASPLSGSSRCEIAIYGIGERDLRIAEDDSILIQKIEQ